MKRCPTCQRTYTEETQKFCASDGTPLVIDEPSTPQVIDESSDFDPEATVISSATKLREESASSKASELPPTQYFDPSMVPPAPPEQDIHQSYPPPQSSPGGQPPPAWTPAPPPQQQYQPSPQQQQQQQPYYPQPGPTGGQPPAPQWQGGQQPPPQYQQQQPHQQQPPPWMPGQQQQPQGQQQWGGGPYQQPGQYAPYAAQPAAGGARKVSLIAMILGILSFIAMTTVFIIIGAKMSNVYELVEPLFYGGGGVGGLALVLGIVGLVMSIKARSSKVKTIVGIVLSIITLILFALVWANMPG